ncbi:hypothetical protein FHP25_13350 [Vineibacter terrae]|uniref:Transcriptional coactivator p15 (PC4) C-terminal domain-containing protein n=1 Tax=Vineibacter terrae TaxID=2586908 RepID=A0A5C8PNK6_9HYPH|nr:transcriptional coactivator p15/PC4 family protein [Vineibacter terrae]TXL75635.1 hypothetical protein FHP25_13350 [Vineibacter terrae]
MPSTSQRRETQPTDPADVVLADIVKNERRGERIRIAQRSYKGREFIDIRLHITTAAGEIVPTSKGVTVPPALLAEVIEGLQDAMDLVDRLAK